MKKISIAIITRNEAANIGDCLRSVAWADEIVVVDAGSTDDTAAICEKLGARVMHRDWTGFADQKQFALEQCSHPWVLSLDADERIRPELALSIRQLLAQERVAAEGYRIARRSYFLGRWIRHCGWYPGYQVRLFRRDRTRVSRSRVHEGFLVDGAVATLTGDIDHYSHPTLHDSLGKLNRYSTLEAFDRLERRRVHGYDFLTHPLAAFLRKYIAQGGFRDGMAGFLLCWVSALLKMVMYMKIWHLQHLPAAEVARREEASR